MSYTVGPAGIRADSIFAAEYVRFNRDGTLNAITIFDQVTSAAFPAQLERFWVCAHLINVQGTDPRLHILRCTLSDADGMEVSSQVAQVFFGVTYTAWVGFGFSEVPLNSPGTYFLRVTHENELCGELALPILGPTIPG